MTKSEEIIENQAVSLTIFSDKRWFQNTENSKFYLRIYSCLGIPWKYYMDTTKKALKEIYYENPIKIHYGIMSGLKYAPLQMDSFATKNGITQFNIFSNEKILPESTYIIFSTPLSVDDKAGDSSKAQRNIDILTSILNMHFGNNYLKDVWYEGILNAKTDKVETVSVAHEVPTNIAGPFLHQLNWQHSEEIIEKIKILPKQKKDIVELALTLFANGIANKDDAKFLPYWIAIEVLCETHKMQKITETLAKYYNISISLINETLFWKTCFTKRHNYFHKGIYPNLTDMSERYIQLLFLDLLRCKLGLSNVNHLPSFLNYLGKNPFSVADSEPNNSERPQVPVDIEQQIAESNDKLWPEIIRKLNS